MHKRAPPAKTNKHKKGDPFQSVVLNMRVIRAILKTAKKKQTTPVLNHAILPTPSTFASLLENEVLSSLPVLKTSAPQKEQWQA